MHFIVCQLGDGYDRALSWHDQFNEARDEAEQRLLLARPAIGICWFCVTTASVGAVVYQTNAIEVGETPVAYSLN